MRLFFYSLVLACLAPFASAAAGDADVLKEFGLLGHLAVDCGAPPSEKNAHLKISVSPDGRVEGLRIYGSWAHSFTTHDVHLLSPGLLQYEEGKMGIFPLTIVIAKIDGKFRIWRSTRFDGTVLIEDGKWTRPTSHEGNPSTVYSVCNYPPL